jgi:hypothetical protein
VQGFGTGTYSGVAGFGDPSSNGTGVFGLGQGPGAPGVRGIGSGGVNIASPSPAGVFGQGGSGGPGVLGSGDSNSNSAGVLGLGGESGNEGEGPGVVGEGGGGAPNDGVQGYGSGTYSGVAGFGDLNNSGTGVFGSGRGPNATGVRGIGGGGQNVVPSYPAVGVFGQGGIGIDASGAEVGGAGVVGHSGEVGGSTAPPFIPGASSFSAGVFGYTTSGIGGDFLAGLPGVGEPGIFGPIGIRAQATMPQGGSGVYQGFAVYAASAGGVAVRAFNTGGFDALQAVAGGTGRAASFDGNVR